jgi:hypothetical protein
MTCTCTSTWAVHGDVSVHVRRGTWLAGKLRTYGQAVGDLSFDAMLTLVGRSSSHHTRIARIFALELRVDCALEVVRDLMSLDPADYAGNPALKLPNLRTDEGVWFGALPICRELARRSGGTVSVVWPEQLGDPLLANAQELTSQAMATEVGLILAKVAAEEGQSVVKLRASLSNSVAWLDANLPAIGAALPARDLSYLEVTLFCLGTHLDFREVLPTAGYHRLSAFCADFGARPSAVATTYHFDR